MPQAAPQPATNVTIAAAAAIASARLKNDRGRRDLAVGAGVAAGVL
jgi:hypothetical protein